MNPLTNRIALTLFLCCAACSPPSDEAEQKPQDESPTPTNRVSIPATVRKNLGITFATVEARHVAGTIRIPGAFELQPLARHEYRMALPGRVALLVDQYEHVDPGQILFRFQSPTWPVLQHEIIEGEQAIDTALADMAVGRATLKEAQRKHELALERIEMLARSDFKNADLVAEAAALAASLPRLEAENKAVETRLENAQRTRQHALHRASVAADVPIEQLESVVALDGRDVPAYQVIEWIDVRASESGIVEALHVTNGAFVESPAMVLSTVDPQRIRFRALALQADLVTLTAISDARIVPPRSPGLTLGDAVDAEFALGLEAHPKERTLTVIATPLESRTWMRPGVSAFLEVVVDATGAPALAIPRSAIVQDGITHVFFRRDPKNPNQAIRVEADMGVSDGRWIAIESGLGRGDEVVLSGAYELKLATEQSGTSQKGGHFHSDGTFHGEDD